MQSESQKKRIDGLEREVELLKKQNESLRQTNFEINKNSLAFKLSEMAKLAHVGFWEYDVQKDDVVWSDETYCLFDYEIGSKINYESILNRIHPEDREKHNMNTQQWIEQGVCEPFEYRILLPNGNIKYVIANGQIENNEKGEALKMLGAITDITKQKETEIKLLHYQERLEEKVTTQTIDLGSNQQLLRTVISEASVILFALDKNGVFTMSEGKGLEKLGLQTGQVVGMSAYELYNDNSEIINSIKTVFSGKEVRMVNQVGDIYFDTVYTPIKSKSEVLGIVGVATDVTDLKQTETLLSERDEQYKRVIEASNTGIWEWNLISNEVYYSPRWKNLLGYKDEELENSIKIWEDLMHPEDKDRMINDLQNFLGKPGGNFERQFRMKHKEGHYIWIQNRSALRYDSKGNLVFMSGSHQDISSQKQSEQKLKEALEYNQKMTETSPVSILVVDKKGQIEFANSRAEKTLGLKKENITELTYNHPDWEITDLEGNDFPLDELPFIRVQKEGKPVYNIEHAIRWPNGSLVYLSINAAPKFDENNGFDGMIATLENISERILRERELKEVFSFREMLIKNAAQGLCVCHNIEEFPYVEFTVWNKQIEKITGYKLDEINELGWYQSLYKDLKIREKAIERMSFMREGEDIFMEEWDIVTKNNELKTISISTSVISTLKGTTHVLALISDVTELKKQRESIKRHNQELERLNEIKDKFLSIISHDLRAPIGSQVQLLDLITNESESYSKEELLKYMKIYSESNKRNYNLLDNILNWIILQLGKSEISFEACSLHESIDEVSNIFKENLMWKNITITKDLEVNLINTNKNILNTLLRNLISNSIKFSEKGGTISMSSRKVNNEFVISVKDHGVGIDETTRKSLFDFKKTTSKEGTNRENGTGLGLSICRDLLVSIGGNIWVESEISKGSCFFFSIPVK